MDKLNFQTAYKDFYQPRNTPTKILVPQMKFIMVEGKGDPNDKGGEFSQAVELLYALSKAIYMSKEDGSAPEGFAYEVPPLEGLWRQKNGSPGVDTAHKGTLSWIAMLRQPDFVTQELFLWACDEVKKTKMLDTGKARLTLFNEGLCVDCIHKGSFDDEDKTLAKIEHFMNDNGLKNDISEARHHHEIYLTVPGDTEVDKMKTVIRIPAK